MPRPAGPGGGADGDAFGVLLARRIVVLTGPLTDDTSTRAGARLMTLDAEGDGPVRLQVTCRDGELDATLALVDTVALMTVAVTAQCRGGLGGPPLAVFAAAEHRTCSPHATFRFGEPRVSVSGHPREVEAQADALRARVDRLVAVLADATGQPVERVAGDLREGRILDAEQARAYGLVHEVTRSSADAGRPPEQGRR